MTAPKYPRLSMSKGYPGVAKPQPPRYMVKRGGTQGHSRIAATVVDIRGDITTKPTALVDSEGDLIVCECFEERTAVMIANLLNENQ